MVVGVDLLSVGENPGPPAYWAYFGDRSTTLTTSIYSDTGAFLSDVSAVALSKQIRLAYGMQIITNETTVADGTIATMSRDNGDNLWRVHVVDPVNEVEYIHNAEADQPGGLGDWSASHILFVEGGSPGQGRLYWFELHCPSDELTQELHAFEATPDLTTITDLAVEITAKVDYFDIFAGVNASATLNPKNAGHIFEDPPSILAQMVVDWPSSNQIAELWLLNPGVPLVGRFEGTNPPVIKVSANGWEAAQGIASPSFNDAHYYPGTTDQPGVGIFKQASDFSDPSAVWQSTDDWNIDEADTAGKGAGEHVHAITRRPAAGDLIVYVLRHEDLLLARPHKGARIIEAPFDQTVGDPTVAIDISKHPTLNDFPDVMAIKR